MISSSCLLDNTVLDFD